MRYYAIKIDGAPAAFKPIGNALIAGAQFCSVIDVGNGWENDYGALRCMFHFMMGKAHGVGDSNGFVRLYGVPMDMLSQASDLSNKTISVYGGFWGGGPQGHALELAKKEFPFAGLMVTGSILTAMGNWKGQDMTLDIFIAPQSTTPPASSAAPTSGEASGTGSSTSFMTSQRMRSRQRSIGAPIRRLRSLASPEQFDNPLSGITGDINSLITAFNSFTGGGWMQTPLNLIHNMMPNMPLEGVLQQTLSAAFPNAKIVSLIQAGLKLTYQDSGFYQSLAQYSGYINALSKSIVTGGNGSIGALAGAIGGAVGGDVGSAISSVGGAVSKIAGGNQNNYPGVNIYAVKDKIILHDGTSILSNVNLNFWDLIGQPTWVSPGKISFMTPMRHDIYPPIMVMLPNDTLQYVNPDPSNTYNGQDQTKYLARSLATTFQGPCQVDTVQVVGDSRHPAGESWALAVTANLTGSTGTAATVGNDQATPNLGGGIGGAAAQSTSARFAARRIRR